VAEMSAASVGGARSTSSGHHSAHHSGHHSGHSRRSRSATGRSAEKPPKKKQLMSKSAATSLASIPNNIKLTIINSGLLSQGTVISTLLCFGEVLIRFDNVNK